MQLLWADKYNKKHGKFLAKWDLVCKPKDQGGLGVLNLRTQNTRIYIFKNLDKFFNHP
jgi:hypothetical protein